MKRERERLITYFPEYIESRQQGRMAGFSIFVSTDGTRDNSSLCYKNGPKLPALNFMTTCITTGRYVTFYNERPYGVTFPAGYEDAVYTELCEVTVNGKTIYNSTFMFHLMEQEITYPYVLRTEPSYRLLTSRHYVSHLDVTLLSAMNDSMELHTQMDMLII